MSIHPTGNFDAVVLTHGIGESSKGNPEVWVKFSTDHGTLTGFFSYTQKAAPYSTQKLRAIGFQGDKFSDLDDGTLLQKHLCNIQVIHDNYNGEVKAKIGFVNRFGDSGFTPERSEGAVKNMKMFDALLRQEAKVTPTLEGHSEQHINQADYDAARQESESYDESNPPALDYDEDGLDL